MSIERESQVNEEGDLLLKGEWIMNGNKEGRRKKPAEEDEELFDFEFIYEHELGH